MLQGLQVHGVPTVIFEHHGSEVPLWAHRARRVFEQLTDLMLLRSNWQVLASAPHLQIKSAQAVPTLDNLSRRQIAAAIYETLLKPL